MISASSYLESDLVLCIGGSWIAKRKIILDRDWEHIEKQAGEVRDLLDKLERDSYEK
jgi:2-keto-3-deoxy-6-phosphogluconate aldolase